MHLALPPRLPANAPFTAVERAWVDGYLAGLLSLDTAEPVLVAADPPEVAKEEDDDFPWHDPALQIEERMALAEGRPLERQLMAAMGQLDCGQCSYNCKAYAEALADGSESKQNRCLPGGKATQRMLKKLLAEGTDGAVTPAAPSAIGAPEALTPTTVTARFAAARPLHSAGTAKDTRHVVIDLAGTGLAYEPGDSLGVIASNDPVLACQIIEALNASPDAEIGDGNGHSRTFLDALVEDKDLRSPTEAMFRLLAEYAADKDQAMKLCLLADDEDPDGDLDELDVLDVLLRYPTARLPAKPFCAALDDLQPRLYSISSSLRAHPDQVHLTVGVTHSMMRERLRKGVASTWFAERIPEGAPLRVYRQPAHGFALPHDDKPVIMIGPGTGIAPFRAFLEERMARRAKGPNWLFFGNPHGATDFLYKEELEAFAACGVLTRLDTAFSRDQADKIYVQDRIREHGAKLWSWLEQGAYLYVCGDAKRMAADVELALQDVAAAHGGWDGKVFTTGLAKAGRYQRDVY